jgi:hypothetical protein
MAVLLLMSSILVEGRRQAGSESAMINGLAVAAVFVAHLGNVPSDTGVKIEEGV